MATNKESEISNIIESLVTTGRKTLDEFRIKQLKKICKTSEEYVRMTYHVLMTHLRKDHSEIRYSALLIINEFILRSNCFRHLLHVDLDEFLELVVESNLDKPLPLPVATAKALKMKGLQFIQAWSTKFSSKYPRFELAITYLQKIKRMDFNDIEAQSAAHRAHQRRRQEHMERVMNEKVKRVRNEIEETEGEISNTLLQMENCFRLLVPHPDEFFSSDDFEMSQDDASLSVPNSQVENKDGAHETSLVENTEDSLRHHGLHNMKKPITIEVPVNSSLSVKVDEDTQPIVENLNDLHRQIRARFFPMVTKWLKILTKGNNCTDVLKKIIDLKQSMESVFQKYKDLKLRAHVPNLDDDEDDDDFVEVAEKEDFEEEAYNTPVTSSQSSQSSSSKCGVGVEKAFEWRLKHSREDDQDPTTAVSTLYKLASKHNSSPHGSDEAVAGPSTSSVSMDSSKSKLLHKAPVLPYDIDLYHWEEEKPMVPERVEFDSLHKFWELKNDEDKSDKLVEVQIASLRTRKIDFSGKFEPVKWTCRAPLPSGKLCPRKDRFKCPFHGKIIERDAVGNPVSPQDIQGTSTQTQPKVPDWQDASLLRDIEAATGIDLKIPVKGKRKKKKECGLTNIRKIQDTARNRLSKKISKRYKHYAKKLDDAEQKRFNDKFGDQWNYY